MPTPSLFPITLLVTLLALPVFSRGGESPTWPEIPPEASAPHVVRLLQMSDEDLTRLQASVDYVQSLSTEEREALRGEIRTLREREAALRERPTGDREGVNRMRQEWQAMQEDLEAAGIAWNALRPEQRRHLFRIYRQTPVEDRPALLRQWRERLDASAASPEREKSRPERERTR